MELVSLKMSKAERDSKYGEIAMDENKDEFPYGLCLYLDADTVAKLGAGNLSAGDNVVIQATGYVKAVNSRDDEYTEGVQTSSDIQITDMALSEVSEDRQRKAKSMYPSSDD